MDEASRIEIGQQSQVPVKEVEAIERSRNEMILTRDEIKEYVESPLVDACERFWDLNVRTLSSSANSKDVGSKASIIIDYDSLSERNKQTAKESGELLEKYDGRPAVNILIPVNEATTVDEIKGRASKIVSRFEKQKAIWIPSYSLQEMRGIYGIDPDDKEYGVNWFAGGNFYYDPKGEKFYLSEEHFKKATEEVK